MASYHIWNGRPLIQVSKWLAIDKSDPNGIRTRVLPRSFQVSPCTSPGGLNKELADTNKFT
jgi:hypothetical protein